MPNAKGRTADLTPESEPAVSASGAEGLAEAVTERVVEDPMPVTGEAASADRDDSDEASEEDDFQQSELDELPIDVSVDDQSVHLRDLELAVRTNRELLGQAERTVGLKYRRLNANRAKVEQIHVDVGNLTSARDSLATWLQERSSSLALRLLDHVDQQERMLKQDEERIRMWVDSPLPENAGRARELRRSFVRTLLWGLFFAVFLPLCLFAVQKWWLGPVFIGSWWGFVIFGLAVLILLVLGGLLAYHRGYISLRREMDGRLAHGRYLLNSIARLRSERARIDGLAPQLRERLAFFGAVLQEPWRVPAYERDDADHDELAQSLPALLQVATTVNGEDPVVARLRSKFVAQHYTVGMRRNAVESLLAIAAETRGLTAQQASMKVIDRDSSTYGLRAALFELVRDPAVLEELGRAKVTEVAGDVQAGLGPSDERPGIERINPDVLSGLRVRQDLLADWSKAETVWDTFLLEVLEEGSALSLLAFSWSGRGNAIHTKFQSIAVAPRRLRAQGGHLIEFLETENETITGTEIVARVDVTDPLLVSEVALFADVHEALSTAHDAEGLSGAGDQSGGVSDDGTL